MTTTTIISLFTWTLVLYVSMSMGVIIAALYVLRPARWRSIAALLVMLMGVFIGWQCHLQVRAGFRNPNQTQQAGGSAWMQWSSAAGGNNHYYALTPTATDWAIAEKLAVSWGGTLATITSLQEQDFINTTFLTGSFEHLPLWIGLVRATNGTFEGAFKWVTDEPFSYSNWKPGEPNNMPPGENVVAINWAYSSDPPRGTKGDWNDTPLNGTTGFGGMTDGPYFGLVERDTDPSRSSKLNSTSSTWRMGILGLFLNATGAFAIVFGFLQFTFPRRFGALVPSFYAMNHCVGYVIVAAGVFDLFNSRWLGTFPGALAAGAIAGFWLVRAGTQFYLGCRRGDWFVFAFFTFLGVLHVVAAFR
jgi:hypothetical protein